MESGVQAIEAYPTSVPDIILIDIGLGEESGFDVCRRLRELDTRSHSTIVFVSGNHNDE